ncbi:MAG: hypothetical protein AAF329_26595 [Cyanobacteria bacterium P01_A01_bin.17]
MDDPKNRVSLNTEPDTLGERDRGVAPLIGKAMSLCWSALCAADFGLP